MAISKYFQYNVVGPFSYENWAIVDLRCKFQF